MKGIAFHWDSPWRDIYSGLDETASAWSVLGSTFDLRMVAIENRWPMQCVGCGIEVVKSFPEFLAVAGLDIVALSDYSPDVAQSISLDNIDWLVFGPSEGWGNIESDLPRWTYRPSPRGGFHSLHLAYIAAHITQGTK